MCNSSDYLVDCDKSLKPLIITFGGICGNISQPLFEFKTFLQKNIDCHFIYMRDSNQSWYHNGVLGLGDTIDELKQNIIKIIETINYSKIITIGSSMGGFASLLFGRFINVDGIISFSPQTFIDKCNRSIYNDSRWTNQIKKLYSNVDEVHGDLLKLDFDGIKVYIIYGNKDELDKIHSERMRIKKNIIVSSYDGNHNVVRTLRDDGTLVKIINGMID